MSQGLPTAPAPHPAPLVDRGWFTTALRRALRCGDLEVSDCRKLSTGVHRLSLRGTTLASVVVKHLDPAAAHRCRLLTRHWLPAAGLAEACPPLLAVVGDVEQTWTVHTWLDGGTLDPHHPGSVQQAVDLVAAIHIRFADHPIITHVRHHCRHLGADHLAGQLRDALRALTAVQQRRPPPAPDLRSVLSGLAEQVRRALEQVPQVRALLQETGWPDTLLHGDLWPQNVAVTSDGPRLLDWDRMGIGPAGYDLSTLLLRLPPGHRQSALDHYLSSLAAAGWPRPSTDEIVTLSTTMERARLANLISWRVLDLRRSPAHATWAHEQLQAIGQWWGDIDPRPQEQEGVSFS